MRTIRIALSLAVLGAPALAQDLPDLGEARELVFAEDGAVEWEVIPDESLSEADMATLDQLNRVQPQPYYGALAVAPDEGLASPVTALAANYHDEENASAAALAACEANRGEEGAPCIVALVIRPEGWEPGRGLQLSSEATAALREEYRALPRRSRALAISPSTGQWAVGESRAAAIASCDAPDCVAVVEG